MLFEDAHALVVGITRYPHAPLPATQDAQDIVAVLQDATCCGYPATAVRTLLDERATRAAILDELDALARTTRESSTVFIYYSGHGGARPAATGGSSYYLVPVDAARDTLEQTGISNVELSTRLRAIPAGRLTLVLDCCRAADLAEPDLAEPPLAQAIAPLAQGRGRVVLAASRSSDNAFAMPGQRNSTMTGHLLAGLRGAAPGVGGVIRICDLFHYVQQRVAGEVIQQHPVFRAELEENYPIAQLRGGAEEAFELPPPPTDDIPSPTGGRPTKIVYDAFLSYCRTDPADRAWVTKVAVPYLERLGLKLCLEHRDFRLGASRLDETNRAVRTSRYTIGVFTPAYIETRFEEYQSTLAAFAAAESELPRFIPLLRKPCELELHTRMTAALDVSDDTEVPAALQRLAVALRQTPQPRLAA